MTENSKKSESKTPPSKRESSAIKNIDSKKSNQTLTPFDEFERLFESFFPRNWLRLARSDWPAFRDLSLSLKGAFPRVDIIDRDDTVVIRAELPGVNKKDINVSITENSVTIKGSIHQEEKLEEGDYVRSEIAHGEFSRTLALPCDVQGNDTQATFENGILELIAPKVKYTKRHHIKIE